MKQACYDHFLGNMSKGKTSSNRSIRPELPAEITLKPYGDPRNVMISR